MWNIGPRFFRTTILMGLELIPVIMYSGLIDNSPFIPAGFKPPSAEQANLGGLNKSPVEAQIEFRGYYQLNGEYRFLLARKDKDRGEWLMLSEEIDSLKVLAFDEKNEKVEVNLNSISGWIRLAEPVEFTGLTVANNAVRNSTASVRTVQRRSAPIQTRSTFSANRSPQRGEDRNFNPSSISVPSQFGRFSSSRTRSSLPAPASGPTVSSSNLKDTIPTISIDRTDMPRGKPTSAPPAERPPRRN